MSVKNEGDEEFDLTFCFHTYFTTSDLPSVGVTDLTGMQKFILKVSKFQNEFMNSSFLPKYEPKIVRISALSYGTVEGTGQKFLQYFLFWEKQWLHKFILKFTDL